MRTRVALLFGWLALSSLIVVAEDSRLLFPGNGFSIAPLEGDVPSPGQPLVMSLPPVEGFSANVNVQIQPYAGSAEEYLELTLQQIETARFRLAGEAGVTGASATFEYTGNFGGRELHWFATATKQGSLIYLVTATALESQWDAYGERLRATVASFELGGGS